jgi:hypothetical protein
MRDAFGNPQCLFSQGEPLRERPAFGVAVAQVGPGGCGDNAIAPAKTGITQLTLEARHIPFQTRDSACIVAAIAIDPTQAEMRLGLQADMLQGVGLRQGTLTVVNGTVHLACRPAMGTQGRIDVPEP